MTLEVFPSFVSKYIQKRLDSLGLDRYSDDADLNADIRSKMERLAGEMYVCGFTDRFIESGEPVESCNKV